MRQEFKQSLEEAAASTQVREEELNESENTENGSDSPPRVIHSHQQHLADYIQICMEEGKKDDSGWGQGSSLDYWGRFFFLCPLWLILHFRPSACWCNTTAWRALLGSPAAQVIDLLSEGLVQTKSVPTTSLIWPILKQYISPPPVPAPASVPVLGVSSLMPADESLTTATESQDVPISTQKHCHITPTLVQSSDSPMLFISSTSPGPFTNSVSYPVVEVSKLAIPMEAYPEHLNQPGGSKEYLCHLCTFRHSNLHCILTHMRKHLDVTIGCPVCGKGYQNVTSLCKHWRDVHSVQIVALADVTEEYWMLFAFLPLFQRFTIINDFHDDLLLIAVYINNSHTLILICSFAALCWISYSLHIYLHTTYIFTQVYIHIYIYNIHICAIISIRK